MKSFAKSRINISLCFKSKSLILVLNLMQDIEQLHLSDNFLVKCISLHLADISCLGN